MTSYRNTCVLCVLSMFVLCFVSGCYRYATVESNSPESELPSATAPVVDNHDVVNSENLEPWVVYMDSEGFECGYKNAQGDIEIALGKYSYCFTEVFDDYAIVAKPGTQGIVAIDRRENILYHVFVYDNGPDYPSDGLFRIQHDGAIGFADAETGQIIIAPQFRCALPYEDGITLVSKDCDTEMVGEHSVYKSGQWYFIDTKGNPITPTEELSEMRVVPRGGVIVTGEQSE